MIPTLSCRLTLPAASVKTTSWTGWRRRVRCGQKTALTNEVSTSSGSVVLSSRRDLQKSKLEPLNLVQGYTCYYNYIFTSLVDSLSVIKLATFLAMQD